MPSPLEIIANSQRPIEVARNTYNNQPGSSYDSNHPNAQSNGDDKGKGELNGSIGSAKDISERGSLTARNRFNTSYTYPDF
jgi:hypothetical protein